MLRRMSDAVLELGKRAGRVAVLATAGTEAKNAGLHAAADLLVEQADEILAANAATSTRPRPAGMEAGPLDRLRLTEARIEAMAAGLRQVAALADPVGEIIGGWVRPNGLEIQQVRVPLGVVAIIYENRPNVTSDAAGLCIKAGQRRAAAGQRHRAAVEPRDRRRAARRASPRPGSPRTR